MLSAQLGPTIKLRQNYDKTKTSVNIRTAYSNYGNNNSGKLFIIKDENNNKHIN